MLNATADLKYTCIPVHHKNVLRNRLAKQLIMSFAISFEKLISLKSEFAPREYESIVLSLSRAAYTGALLETRRKKKRERGKKRGSLRVYRLQRDLDGQEVSEMKLRSDSRDIELNSTRRPPSIAVARN